MADTNDTRYNLEEVSTNLTRMKSMLFIMLDSDGLSDDLESVSTMIGMLTDMVIASQDLIETHMKQESEKTKAFPDWLEHIEDLETDSLFEDWHPELKDFIEQVSARIGKQSAEKSKKKLIQLAANTAKYERVENVIKDLKSKVKYATPYIIDSSSFDAVETFSEMQKRNLDLILRDFDQLKETLIACGDIKFKKEKVA